MTQTSQLSKNYMDMMIVREHVDRKDNMHPNAKKRWNEMTKAPEPLKFEMHTLKSEKAQDIAGDASYDLFEQYKDFHENEPLKPL